MRDLFFFICCTLLMTVTLDLHAQLADSPWPSYGNNNQNTGLSQYVGPGQDSLLWTYEIYQTIPASPTIGSDGTIYYTADSMLHAVNPDGSRKWVFEADSTFRGQVPTLTADGHILVGANDTTFYALNQQGNVEWTYYTEGRLAAHASVVDDGTIYLVAGKKLLALDSDGRLQWSYTAEYPFVNSPAVGPSGTIYVASKDFLLHSVSPEGNNNWQYNLEDHFVSAPVVDKDGTVYIGATNTVYALNARGSLIWSYTTEIGFVNTPVIGPYGNIYVSGEGEQLVALDEHGNKRWEKTIEHRRRESLTIDQSGKIYIGSHYPGYGENFYVFSSNGTLEWKYDIYGSVTTPAIGKNGRLYVTASDRLYAFKTDNLAPELFRLKTPASNSIVEKEAIDFKWEQSTDDNEAGTVTYELQLKGPDSTVHSFDARQNTAFTVDENLKNRSYYHWRVIAKDQNGGQTVNLYNYRQFGYDPVNVPPERFSLQEPQNGNVLRTYRPSFSWEASADSNLNEHVTYELFISEDSTFSTKRSYDSDTTYIEDEIVLGDNTRYYWYVKASDPNGASTYSDTLTFSVNTQVDPPASFELLYPANHAQEIARKPPLRWQKSDGRDPGDSVNYKVSIAKDSLLSSDNIELEAGSDTTITVNQLLDSETRYYWSVTAIDTDSLTIHTDTLTFVTGTETDLESSKDLPDDYKLQTPYPNPFNPRTTLKYEIPEASKVTITMYNIVGQRIQTLVNQGKRAGTHKIQIDGTGLTSGTYIIRMRAGEFSAEESVILLK